jgi:hypothetical protein|tara:strand:+ start:257 stop:430 length:174 start_codon:yes stop_codon:yes gene_type:complete
LASTQTRFVVVPKIEADARYEKRVIIDDKLRKLWAKAVGTEGYDKEEWESIIRLLHE